MLRRGKIYFILLSAKLLCSDYSMKWRPGIFFTLKLVSRVVAFVPLVRIVQVFDFEPVKVNGFHKMLRNKGRAAKSIKLTFVLA